jgi:hypothetical protein
LKRLLALLLILAVGGIAAYMAQQKAFWFDEIVALSVAEASSPEDFWRRATAGYEFNPPLSCLSIIASEKLFGRGELTSRLPFILAGMLTLWFLFQLQSLRKGPWAGFWTLLLFINTEALQFFYEARGYIWVLCFLSLAWWLWAKIESGQSSLLLYAAFTTSIIGALLSHMWAVVIPCAFLITMLVRPRANARAILALAAASPALLLYPPLVDSSRLHQFNNPTYQAPLLEALRLILAGMPLLILVLILAWFVMKPYLAKASPWPRLDSHTLLATLLLASPLLIYALTHFGGSQFMRRYCLVFSLAACVVLGEIVAAALSSTNPWLRRLPVLLALGLLLFQVRITEAMLNRPADFRQGKFSAQLWANTTGPILFGNGIEFLSATIYAEPQIKQRLRFLADIPSSIRYTGSDGIDSALLLGKSDMHLNQNVVDWPATNEPFWLISTSFPLDWIERALRDRNFQLTPRPDIHPEAVFVQPPTASESAPAPQQRSNPPTPRSR